MELSLADRLRFHRLLSHLSARLGNTRAVDLDREVHGALGRIVDFAAVDHATIVEFADRAGQRRSCAIGDPLDHERTLSVMDRVRAGEDVRVLRPEDVPDDAASRSQPALVRLADAAGIIVTKV